LAAGVLVDGKMSTVGESFTMEEGKSIQVGDWKYRYRTLQAEGYLGILEGDSSLKVGLAEGQTVELGREPGHPGLLLPARNSQDNIRWCNGARAARAKERGFTLDNVLTGRRQAQVIVTETGAVSSVSIHETCPSFLLREKGNLQRLGPKPHPLYPNDLLIMGATVVALRANG
jgi:hypothetical protein